MDHLKSKIRKLSKNKGMDLIGIAPVERFQDAPEGFHPRDILPEATSVIVLAKYFPFGLLQGKSKSAVTRAHETVFALLDQAAFEVAVLIEKQGKLALPIPADTPYESWDAENKHGRADLSHKHAAVLAGLGVLGKNSLLITPEYGNLVNLVSIITSAELPGDPIITQELCLPKCRQCINICPVNAIQENGIVIQKECRKAHSITTLKNYHLFSCWLCRKVCPA
ncbi:MAG: epoxyqueuosine reductase [Desulfobacteraceae bacterium]|nr:MAG: epoxyqueuosine reductase [Desulfobacteraceae bacterium]